MKVGGYRNFCITFAVLLKENNLKGMILPAHYRQYIAICEIKLGKNNARAP